MWWHTTPDTHRAIVAFHENRARHRQGIIDVLDKKFVKNLTSYFHDYLINNGFANVIEVVRIGSTVERTCVADPVEFDLLFILPYVPQKLNSSTLIGHHEFHFLTKNGQRFLAENFSNDFYDHIEAARQGHHYLSRNSVIEKRGVTSYLLHIKSEGKTILKMDLIPAVQRESYDTPQTFIPRSYLSRYAGFKFAWCMTYPYRDIHILTQYKETSPLLMCLRIIKAIQNDDPQLRFLLSSTIKAVVMKRMDETWSVGQLGTHVLRCLQALESGFAIQKISHHMDPVVNLLQRYSQEQVSTIHRRLKELIQHQNIFLQAITPTSGRDRGQNIAIMMQNLNLRI